MPVQLETGRGAFDFVEPFSFVLISTGSDLFGYSRTGTLREIKTQEMEKSLQYTQNTRTLVYIFANL